jgi:hypothetical protein
MNNTTTTITVPVTMLGESANLIHELAERLGVEPAAVLASAWDVAQLVNNVDPDWDALLAGDENDDMLGAAKVIMGAISIHAQHRRTQLKAA